MADVWANSMACHPRATCHTAGCCHLVNSLSRFQSHMPHYSHLAKSMSWSCDIAGCKNSIRHTESRFSPYCIFLFLMRFRVWRAAAFVSSPIHLFTLKKIKLISQCYVLSILTSVVCQVTSARPQGELRAGGCCATMDLPAPQADESIPMHK